MNILIVGAGAVGQVYGLALQRAGNKVAFLVKPAHAAGARSGFTLYRLGRGAPAAEPFKDFGVYTSADEARGERWDQVWLAVSGTAIHGHWLEEVVAATGDATVVSLQPGTAGRERVGPLAVERLVTGVIAFIAYQAPLPGETRIPTSGIAYWYPPGPSPFAGSTGRVAPIVEALRRGGCPAKAVASTDAPSTFGSALMVSFIASLDAVGWDWERLKAGDPLALATRVWREAVVIGARRIGVTPPFWARFVGPGAMRLAMWVLPRFIPIDLPTYVGYHFTKVGDQTRAHIDGMIRDGGGFGLPVVALRELRGRMGTEARFPTA